MLQEEHAMNVLVVGTGHMGSWLAGELSKENRVAAFDRDRRKMDQVGAALHLSDIAEVADFRPDLFINAVSLQHTIPVFEQASPYLHKHCIICDVASIKGKIADYYRTSNLPFVSVHPMFGPTFGDMERLKEENAVIISESGKGGKDFFQRFFEKLGCRIFQYTFREHDRMMAYSLTTPFVSSMVFAACVDAKAVPGTTFKRHMAIARGLLSEDDHLLTEILLNPYSVTELEKITQRLEFLKHIIRAGDEGEARDFIQRLRENIEES
jgi:prephenate dehydrogenase